MFVPIYYRMLLFMYIYVCIYIYKGKGEGVPEQAKCGPEVSRRFRLSDFITFDT